MGNLICWEMLHCDMLILEFIASLSPFEILNMFLKAVRLEKQG